MKSTSVSINQSGAASALLADGGNVTCVVLDNGAGAGTITLYDGTSASGVKRLSLQVAADSTYSPHLPEAIQFKNGIYAVTTGANLEAYVMIG